MSVLLYGAETWFVNLTLEARITGFDSRAMGRIESIHWSKHVTKEELRERTQQPYASVLAGQKHPHWFGHVRRLPLNYPTHLDPRRLRPGSGRLAHPLQRPTDPL